jgi:hypothetical protein
MTGPSSGTCVSASAQTTRSARPPQTGAAVADRRPGSAPGRYPVQDLPHQRLLHVDQRVARLVIACGPRPVARHGANLAQVGVLPEPGGAVKQGPGLRDALLGEPAVEPVAREGAQQRDAFQAKQEGKRVPASHKRRP